MQDGEQGGFFIILSHNQIIFLNYEKFNNSLAFSPNYNLVPLSYKIRRVSRNLIFTPLVAQGAEVVGQPVAYQAAVMEMWAFLELLCF